jgi:glycosyltransferase involved in cell wall biosynthesis
MHKSEFSRPRRLLIVVTTIGFTGGAEAQVARLAMELKARNWEVCIAAMVKPPESVAKLEREKIPVCSLNMKRRIPDVRAIFRLGALIRNFKPDVVHCHMYHANILGRITRLFYPIPALICTAHNTKEASTRGGPTWNKELLYRLTDGLAEKTTIICNAGFERYIGVGAVPRRKLQMIPNGVDTELFNRSEQMRARARKELGLGARFTWLAVGRLVLQKDYPNLFQALEGLKQHDFSVLIAGIGPLEEELRRSCEERGLNEIVRFCGVRENIVSLYNAADAFVMSSECEGLPMALLEATSMQLPAVVTEVGGNPEVVADEVTGYVVPPKAPAELGAAMLRLMQAPPEERSEMGRRARERCHKQYGITAIVDQWVKLYEKCLQSNSKGTVTGKGIRSRAKLHET